MESTPYNGSVRLDNQNSPYVQTAVDDAQRAGVSVSSIYYRDAGMRGEATSLSGQSYLQQVADGTGGQSYYQGSFNPVSLLPYLKQFTHDISETYIATFKCRWGGRGARSPPAREDVEQPAQDQGFVTPTQSGRAIAKRLATPRRLGRRPSRSARAFNPLPLHLSACDRKPAGVYLRAYRNGPAARS